MDRKTFLLKELENCMEKLKFFLEEKFDLDVFWSEDVEKYHPEYSNRFLVIEQGNCKIFKSENNKEYYDSELIIEIIQYPGMDESDIECFYTSRRGGHLLHKFLYPYTCFFTESKCNLENLDKVDDEYRKAAEEIIEFFKEKNVPLHD